MFWHTKYTAFVENENVLPLPSVHFIRPSGLLFLGLFLGPGG